MLHYTHLLLSLLLREQWGFRRNPFTSSSSRDGRQSDSERKYRTIKIELKYRPCSIKHEIKNQTRFLFKIYRKIFDSDQMKS
jgi:head-tail adaptor